ncbi:MAG TPA: hypothetical protein ENK48_00690 [Gammaproteobacteria bacterium]|nr:hypothetical protein [Gammaproteobacteria bacterium]
MTVILDGLLFVLVNGLVLHAAYSLAGWVNPRGASLAQLAVTTGIAYLAQATVVVLFLGVVLHQLGRDSVVLAASLLALALSYLFRGFRAPLRPALAAGARRIVAERDPVLYLLLVLFVLQAAVLLAKVVWLPPHVWDVFYYHLTPAVEWYQHGAILPAIDTPARHMNAVPLGMTVLSYWFFIFFRDDALVELPMLLWALLLVPLTHAILRKSDVRPAWALKFAIVVFFIPIVLLQAVTCKDHLGLNIALLAALFFLASYLQTGSARQLVPAGLALGLMVGYKQAGMAYLGVALLFFLALLVLNRRDLLRDPARRAALFKGGAAAAILAAVVGGYWWLKKVFKVGLSGLAALPPPRPALDGAGGGGRFGWDAFVANLGEFLPRAFDFRAPYGADLPNISGFGPQFAAFGLLGLAAGVILLFHRAERRRPFYLILVTTIALFGLFLLARYSANGNSYRTLSFLPMVMIAYAAILLHRRGLLARRWVAAAANTVMVGSVLWNFALILPPAFTNPMLLREYVSMDADFRTSGTYTKWFIIHRPSLYRLLPAMPADEPVAIVSQPVFGQWFRKGQAETWSYPYYDRHWRRRLVYFHRKPYLECARRRHLCRPTAALKRDLAAAGMRLVSSCPTNHCVTIQDRDFVELAPGFYYFRGGEKG